MTTATTCTHVRDIAEVARLRRRHDAKAAAARDDATVTALGRELKGLDQRMTDAADRLMAKRTLTDTDLRALALVLRHFSEEGEDGGLVLDDRPVVEMALARLLGHLCGDRARAVGNSDA